MCTPPLGRHAIQENNVTSHYTFYERKTAQSITRQAALFFYFSTSSSRRPSNVSEKGTLNEGRGLVLS
jgi:hypothetical protein